MACKSTALRDISDLEEQNNRWAKGRRNWREVVKKEVGGSAKGKIWSGEVCRKKEVLGEGKAMESKGHHRRRNGEKEMKWWVGVSQGGWGWRERGYERRDSINHSNQYCMSPLRYDTHLLWGLVYTLDSFYFNGSARIGAQSEYIHKISCCRIFDTSHNLPLFCNGKTVFSSNCCVVVPSQCRWPLWLSRAWHECSHESWNWSWLRC